MQNGCLRESRLAAGHRARGAEGSAGGGVDFACYYIPIPSQEAFLFFLRFNFNFEYMYMLGWGIHMTDCSVCVPVAVRGGLWLPCSLNYGCLQAALDVHTGN